jgi:hypothetical protein
MLCSTVATASSSGDTEVRGAVPEGGGDKIPVMSIG